MTSHQIIFRHDKTSIMGIHGMILCTILFMIIVKHHHTQKCLKSIINILSLFVQSNPTHSCQPVL